MEIDRVEWKYLNGKCLELIGLIGNMLELYGNVLKNICLKKRNNLELESDEVYEMDII